MSFFGTFVISSHGMAVFITRVTPKATATCTYFFVYTLILCWCHWMVYICLFFWVDHTHVLAPMAMAKRAGMISVPLGDLTELGPFTRPSSVRCASAMFLSRGCRTPFPIPSNSKCEYRSDTARPRSAPAVIFEFEPIDTPPEKPVCVATAELPPAPDALRTTPIHEVEDAFIPIGNPYVKSIPIYMTTPDVRSAYDMPPLSHGAATSRPVDPVLHRISADHYYADQEVIAQSIPAVSDSVDSPASTMSAEMNVDASMGAVHLNKDDGEMSSLYAPYESESINAILRNHASNHAGSMRVVADEMLLSAMCDIVADEPSSMAQCYP